MASESGRGPGTAPSDGGGIAAAIGGIETAGDEATLHGAVDRAHEEIAAALRAHTPAPTLAAAWSEVLRHSVAAAVQVIDGGEERRWTWYVSGSVGRGEAAPGSDVETMIGLDDSVTEDAKTDIMQRAAHVHAVLERCGVHGDANGVLASRSRFCRRHTSWSDGITRWCAQPAEDRGVVMTGLTADSTALQPAVRPGVDGDGRLRAAALRAFQSNYPARKAMLQDATTARAVVPSRLRTFASGSDSVDVKLAAIDPVVKIARWAGLSAGCDATSTSARLDAAAAAGVLDADDVSSLHDCYQWLLRLRWRTRAGVWIAGGRVTDVVTLSEMAPQERAMLRNVAREVAGISRKLTYLASTSAFR